MSRPKPQIKLRASASLLAVVLLAGSAAAQTSWAPQRPEIPPGLDLYLPVPEDNPLTPEKVALGRKLFLDPILSRDRSLACASCHDPERGFTDGRTVSVGVFARKGTRNVPTLINRAYGRSFFWDGRITGLEEQVLKPIQDPKEMDMTLDEVVARLNQETEYRQRFQTAFGRAICAQDVAKALASFVRTILSGGAPVDRYYLTGDATALSEPAMRGLRLFQGKGRCTACHLGPTFTDERFHNTGVAWRDGRLLDEGRYAITKREADRGAFKTPTLREVSRTAPYMHDGSLATLADVVERYNGGGIPNPHLDNELRPLHLTTEEKQELVAFLRSLSTTPSPPTPGLRR